MEIIEAASADLNKWNDFVAENFPPVGAFFQSWEWGDFKASLGSPVKRYIAASKGEWLAVFSLEKHILPFGLEYDYAPRGPVLNKSLADNEASRIFTIFAEYAAKNFKRDIFVRLEPPMHKHNQEFFEPPFALPRYYIQPTTNLIVDLAPSEEEILKSFSRDMRHDLHLAERRGITAALKTRPSEADFEGFLKMQKDTAGRAGKEIYPEAGYYRKLFDLLPPVLESQKKKQPSFGLILSYAEGAPAAAHLVIFFGSTATYLFGASYSGKGSAKASSYLHWASIKEAKKLGFSWYDIGGIDPIRWPSLSYFKNQFRGKILSYIGNLDLILKPKTYWLYNKIRKIRYPEN